MTGKNNKHAVLRAWMYVLAQGTLLVLLVFIEPNIGPQIHRSPLAGRLLEILGVLGVLLSAASLRRSLTAVPIPKEDGRLSTTGLYKYVRHPMYSSVLLLSLGISVSGGSLIKYLFVIFLYILFYFKSLFEEKYLVLKYPKYPEYSARVPRFIPFTK